MKIKYTDHLEFRISYRDFPRDLPLIIYRESEEHYFDRDTENYVAVKEVLYQGKQREMMVAYIIVQDDIELITIHPLKKGQKQSRIKTGRWIRHEIKQTNH